jgi:hypothetical protein
MKNKLLFLTLLFITFSSFLSFAKDYKCLVTPVIAVDKNKTGYNIKNWHDLYSVEENVSITSDYNKLYYLLCGMSYGLEGNSYSFKESFGLLNNLHKKNRLKSNSLTSAIRIRFDYEAVALKKYNPDIEIIIPNEGSISFPIEFLHDDKVNISNLSKQKMLKQGFRLIDKTFSYTLDKGSYKYCASFNDTGISKGSISYESKFKRQVLGQNIIFPSDNIELNIISMFCIILTLVFIFYIITSSFYSKIKPILIGIMTFILACQLILLTCINIFKKDFYNTQIYTNLNLILNCLLILIPILIISIKFLIFNNVAISNKHLKKLFLYSPLQISLFDKENRLLLSCAYPLEAEKDIKNISFNNLNLSFKNNLNSTKRLETRFKGTMTRLATVNSMLINEQTIYKKLEVLKVRNELFEKLKNDVQAETEELSFLTLKLKNEADETIKKSYVSKMIFLLNYIKRKCNLVLNLKENTLTPSKELIAYMNEFIDFANFAGSKAMLVTNTDKALPRDTALFIYELFYYILEYSTKNSSSLFSRFFSVDENLHLEFMLSCPNTKLVIPKKFTDFLDSKLGNLEIIESDESLIVRFFIPI